MIWYSVGSVGIIGINIYMARTFVNYVCSLLDGDLLVWGIFLY